MQTIEENKDPRLPGAMIMFASTSCTGSSEDQYGVGDMDLSLYRPVKSIHGLTLVGSITVIQRHLSIWMQKHLPVCRKVGKHILIFIGVFRKSKLSTSTCLFVKC